MTIEHYVQDWAAVKKRWEAWWQCGLYDRPVIAVTAPRDGVPPYREEKVSPETRWTDADYMVRSRLESIRTTYFGGEALPLFFHNLAIGHALLLGCPPRWEEESAWVDPAPVAADGYPLFDGWRENPWWPWMLESTRTAVAGSQGRYFVMPAWGNSAGDNLSLARGPQQLMLDLAENPAWVRRAAKQASDILMDIFHDLWELVAPERVGIEGSVNYCGCWSPGRTLSLDCDLSCMISPETFREIFLPPLIETTHTVDHCNYHLDGWVALHHLEALLDVPELHGIQWVPGAGREDIMQWVPLIQRIQQRRKNVTLSVRPEEIEGLLREVRPEGLYLVTTCRTEGEARALVERVAAKY
jgi:hypothetical protein